VIEPLAAARAIHLAAAIVAVGMIFFELVVARPVLGRSAAAATYIMALHRWIAGALIVALPSGFAWALLVAMQVGDAPAAQVLIDGTLTTLLTETRFGQVWLWRTLCLAVVVLTFLSTNAATAWFRLIAASAMLAAVAWVGHAGARTDAVGWLQVIADMAHLLAAGLWLGSLPALAILLAHKLPSSASAAATRRFSTFGIVSVVTLLISGAFNTYLLTDSILALPETKYGQLLLLKVVLFAGMLVLAAINKWHWTPKLPARPAVGAIRRHSLIEAGLGVAVLIAVGVLGTLPPPLHRHVHASDATADEPFVHIHDVRGMADIKFTTAGDIEIRLMQEDFTPLTARAVTIQLSQAGQSTITLDAESAIDGLWRTPSVALPTRGIWTIAVIIQRSDNRSLVLDGPILIGPSSPAKSE
jgi:putative copper resistance protein D